MISNLVLVIHLLSVFWLVGGIVSRDLVHAMVVKAPDLAALRARHEVASFCERVAVRPATFLVLATGLIAAWRRGWPILGFLQGSPIQWPLVSLLVYLSIIPMIALVFAPRGRVFRRALEAAEKQGRITPALRAALGDPMVSAARVYEILMVMGLTILMVTKPF